MSRSGCSFRPLLFDVERSMLNVRCSYSESTALEGLAAVAYGQNVLSLEQVRRLLRLESSWAAKALLAKHGSWPGMTVEDFREDLAVMDALRASV